ncbi:MAG: FeoB-associated Cys-rich membrane protein, partial [Treponema sp.]|nr:FeoB-associated Cys-rich membrane protein [Treponema sp.]
VLRGVGMDFIDFITGNLSTIVVGALVFGVLGFVLFNLIRGFCRGKTACSCGCPGCENRTKIPGART